MDETEWNTNWRLRLNVEESLNGKLQAAMRIPPPIHGKTCGKVPHKYPNKEYGHHKLNDDPYEVNEQRFCGRCHKVLKEGSNGNI